MRKEWLAFSYVCQVCLNSRHSNYALIAPLAKSPKIWPSRSTPCLHNAIDLLMRHHPTALSYSNEYYCDYWCPPWIQNNMNPLPFPLLKQEAAERPHVAQNALLQIIGSFPPSSLVACTDGSLTTNGSCSCAVFIKDYTGIAKKTRSWIKHQLSWARRDTTSARIFPQSSQPTCRVCHLLRFPINRESYLGLPTTFLSSVHPHYQASCKRHHHVRQQSLDHLDPQPRRNRR